MRFCYFPKDSKVPRQYHCQPGMAIQKAEQKDIAAWLKPGFTDLHYGHPGYAQLYLQCPVEVRTGAEDEAEMGVFHHLQQPQREANLSASLEEYLRVGLEAGIFYVT